VTVFLRGLRLDSLARVDVTTALSGEVNTQRRECGQRTWID